VIPIRILRHISDIESVADSLRAKYGLTKVKAMIIEQPSFFLPMLLFLPYPQNESVASDWKLAYQPCWKDSIFDPLIIHFRR
jgi:hypothetical protein